MNSNELIERCRDMLKAQWDAALATDGSGSLTLSQEMRDEVSACINSSTKSYRYVLPTQILAKVVDSSLDCRCIQVKRGGQGAFDARTIAHGVIVPFDQENHRVLGGSPEPYVNNPLRVTEITPDNRDAQKDSAGWDRLCRLLQVVEDRHSVEFTLELFREVLHVIKLGLRAVHIVYPVPNRTSLEKSLEVVTTFLERRSGGARFQNVVAAMFEVIGERFHIFSRIRRSRTNAADSQADSVADIECIGSDDKIVMAVEAKDRRITIRQIDSKLPLIRERGVKETFFITALGVVSKEEEDIRQLLQNEFAAGQNIYVLELDLILRSVLAMIGEEGRRAFLKHVGGQLDEYGELADRQEWVELLRTV